jgi:hypothetical protein
MHAELTPGDEALAAAVRAALVGVGAGTFEGALGAAWLAALQREWRARRQHATGTQRERYVRYTSLRCMSSPSRYAAVKPGRALDALHRRRRLVATLEGAAGCRLRPTRASYLYYGAGDYMGLHTDAAPCFLTLLVPVAGPPPALTVFPDLVGVSAEQLALLARPGSGLAAGGREVPFPACGFVALQGNRVPHQRERVPEGAQVGVATLCFAPIT